MIQELFIQDFAIISELHIHFKEGMTVLTGETGAGKSIIIDAVSLLVGGRGSTDFIREQADRLRIEGSFGVKKPQKIARVLSDVGVDMADDQLILQREIYRSGRNSCRINGQLVNTATLREVGKYLVDIHGQNEHQELMQASRHIKLLDEYGQDSLKALLARYREAYETYRQTAKTLDEFQRNEQEYVQRMDMLQFQFDEIAAAQLTAGEEEALLEERKKLANFQKIAAALQNSYDILQGEPLQTIDKIGLAMEAMASIEELDEHYKSVSEMLKTSYYTLQEAVADVSSLQDTLEMDEGRLEEVDNRLDTIRQLKRKYGDSVDAVLAYAEEIEKELSSAVFSGARLEELQQQLLQQKETVYSLAADVTAARRLAAERLEKDMMVQLRELYMADTVFSVQIVSDSEKIGPRGQDEVAFFISTNIGESLKPLVKIASGGELSRMMLALKTIFSKSQEITSIVFDEVDTGVSGRVAQAIAEKIHQIAENSQVLCITHLPQVGAVADTQYYIRKEVSGNRTKTFVQELDEAERAEEIARMLSGSEVTALTLEHAQELLAMAKEKPGTV